MHPASRKVILGALGTAAAMMPAGAALADYKDDLRYTQLKAELGADTPDGSGVRMGQVEARVNDWHYGVDITLSEFQRPDRQYFFESGATQPSTHANEVARKLYGVNSMTPAVPEVYLYSATWRQDRSPFLDGWVDTAYLRRWGGPQPPKSPPQDQRPKVVNHSWVMNYEGWQFSTNTEVARRLDYVVQSQDQIHVTGVPNPGLPGGPHFAIPGTSFNVITVGLTNGNHVSGTMNLEGDSNYNASRTRPDIVAPDTGTSYAAPQVASAAALLVDTANRRGHASGDKPVVIRAALLAGANKQVAFGGVYSRNTANGLNNHYGAGQIDVYTSYHIINAGQPDSGGGIGQFGFAYQDAFTSEQVDSYRFRTRDKPVALQASLVWNVDITPVSIFNEIWGASALYDLDLALYDVTDGETLLQSSLSTTDNTENLWLISLSAEREYELRVFTKEGQEPFTWDYALAWQFSGEVTPVPEAGGLVELVLIGLLLQRRPISQTHIRQ